MIMNEKLDEWIVELRMSNVKVSFTCSLCEGSMGYSQYKHTLRRIACYFIKYHTYDTNALHDTYLI